MQCYINNGVVKAACEAGVRGEGEKHARERAIYAGEKMPFRSDVQLKGSFRVIFMSSHSRLTHYIKCRLEKEPFIESFLCPYNHS